MKTCLIATIANGLKLSNEDTFHYMPYILFSTHPDRLRLIEIFMALIRLFPVWQPSWNTMTSVSIGGPSVFHDKHIQMSHRPCLVWGQDDAIEQRALSIQCKHNRHAHKWPSYSYKLHLCQNSLFLLSWRPSCHYYRCLLEVIFFWHLYMATILHT